MQHLSGNEQQLFVIKIKCKKEKQFLQIKATEKTTRYALAAL